MALMTWQKGKPFRARSAGLWVAYNHPIAPGDINVFTLWQSKQNGNDVVVGHYWSEIDATQALRQSPRGAATRYADGMYYEKAVVMICDE